tara:strand:- start:2655 stop:3611 length:957 start_codon:yes stop_codon:yes gene_type:complete
MSNVLINIFKQFLGECHSHNEESSQVAFDCPACAEDKGLPYGKTDGKYKLSLNYKKNIFRCWVCCFENNMHGTIPKLIKRYGNKNILKEYLLLQPDDYKSSTDSIKVEVKLPEGFKKLSLSNNQHFKFDSAYDYIKKRGITDEMIDYYNIGYTIVGKYHDRIILPSYDEFGDLNYFVARAWNKWLKPKYLNPIAEKQSLIFNENKINWDCTIYLVEGAFDHIAVPNSIPLLGKVLAENLRLTLYTKAKADIILLLDGEAYGDALKIYRTLNLHRLYNRIKICVPNYKEDPSSVFEKFGYKGIVKLLKKGVQIPESKLY